MLPDMLEGSLCRRSGHGQARKQPPPGRVSCCIGEITLISSAAGRPRVQFGRSMSAGRVSQYEPGTRLGASFVGAKAAD